MSLLYQKMSGQRPENDGHPCPHSTDNLRRLREHAEIVVNALVASGKVVR